MSLWPAGEFTSLFRLLDDYDVHRSGRGGTQTHTSNIRAFRPRFDVREVKDSYELHGELPGIEQKDVNIEFVDPNTMVITGRVERDVSSSGSSGAPPAADGKDKRKDEGKKAATAAAAAGGKNGDAIADESAAEHTYWVSERSVGEFHRSFSFPQRVDQDGVSASLKNGILSVTVPKMAAPVARKIRID